MYSSHISTLFSYRVCTLGTSGLTTGLACIIYGKSGSQVLLVRCFGLDAFGMSSSSPMKSSSSFSCSSWSSSTFENVSIICFTNLLSNNSLLFFLFPDFLVIFLLMKLPTPFLEVP